MDRLSATGLSVLLIFTACDLGGHLSKSKQVRTVALLRAAGDQLDQIREQRALTDRDAAELLADSRFSTDAWGNRIGCRIRLTSGGTSYVLVSNGSDGIPDRPIEEQFMTLKPYPLANDTEDIVYRDGQLMTLTGK